MGWALRLSRNLCIDHYRRSRQERKWHRVTEAVLEQLPASGDFEADLQRRQHLEAVYEGLSELEEAYAEPVLLCDLQGLSWRRPPSTWTSPSEPSSLACTGAVNT